MSRTPLATVSIANQPDALAARLAAVVGRIFPDCTGVTELQRLTGGSSQETWAFVAAAATRRELIMRRGLDGIQQRSSVAAGLAKEAQLIERAHRAGLPVPNVRWVLEPADGLGEGFIMDRLQGETIARKILRDAQFAPTRPLLAEQCGVVLARLHALAVSDVLLRQAEPQGELDQYYRKYTEQADPHPVFEIAFRWLRDNQPRGRFDSLVHGDFRLGNLMITAAGLAGVLDWELAHLGDPMEDLGYLCVPSWRFGNLDNAVGGFGQREQLYAAYERAGGRIDTQRARWWEIFGILKWGVVCGGMALTFRNGIDPSVERGTIGRRASETEIDLLRELLPAPPR